MTSEQLVVKGDTGTVSLVSCFDFTSWFRIRVSIVEHRWLSVLDISNTRMAVSAQTIEENESFLVVLDEDCSI